MDVLKWEDNKFISKELENNEEYYSIVIEFLGKKDIILRTESLWDLFLLWQRFKNKTIIKKEDSIFRFIKERTLEICH